MINLLLVLVFMACLGITAAWLAENPGHLTLYWFDYRVDTSAVVLLIAMAIGMLLLTILHGLFSMLLSIPSRYLKRRSLKHYEKGLKELTYSVASLAVADSKNAELHTRKAEKWLGATPLTLLLSAQIARSQGNDSKTRQLLEHMLDHAETEYLAARLLSDAASKQQLLPKALELAERAHTVNPKEWASTIAMVSLHIKLRQWQEALQAIHKASRKASVRRSEIRHLQGLVHMAWGSDLLEKEHHEEALSHAHLCQKLLPDFTPATTFAARVYLANEQAGKAQKVILGAWKNLPHPDLTALLEKTLAGEPKAKQLKWVQKLAAAFPAHAESQIALATIASLHQEWELARKSLKAAMAIEETARACKMMAEIEQKEFSDFDAAGRWAAKSANASLDPSWVCDACGQAASHWEVHCPTCGSFDTLMWKQRKLQLAA